MSCAPLSCFSFFHRHSFYVFLFLFFLISSLAFLLSASEVFIFSSSCAQFPTAPLFPPRMSSARPFFILHSSFFTPHSNEKKSLKAFLL